MRCGEVPMLKAANFGYGKFISCNLTENSGQKLLPTNMHRMAPAVLHTLIWTEAVVGLTIRSNNDEKTCIYLIPCFDHWTGRKG